MAYAMMFGEAPGRRHQRPDCHLFCLPQETQNRVPSETLELQPSHKIIMQNQAFDPQGGPLDCSNILRPMDTPSAIKSCNILIHNVVL